MRLTHSSAGLVEYQRRSDYGAHEKPDRLRAFR